jgi:alkanesulfonate monooxygenase SsuD/methylene tetrahydromethanopterin reductase-like flavin-dependent oxidoreductase (luciferase family)
VIAAHSPGYVAESDAQAREEAWPHFSAMMNRIGQERGWRPMSRRDFEQSADADGALFVGSPETVAAKIVKVARALSLSRFDLKYSMGTMPHEKLMSCINLYGTAVAPLVHEQLVSARLS